MLEKVIGTFGTRVIYTLLMLVIMIISAHSFGSTGLGVIALFVLNITILQNISSFIGGPSLIYMLPRGDNFQLFFLSYLFGFLTNVLGTFILYLTHSVPYEYVWHLLLGSIFLSLFYVNVLFLLSREEIKLYNILTLIQIIFHLVLLIVFRFVYGITDVSAYMYSYGLSYVLSFVLSFYYVLQRVRYMGFSGIFVLLGAMFKYGFFIQVANFSQLLNYRLSYYVITFVSGARPLGLFDCGTKLSEAVWVFPKSISTVLYTRISNCGADNAYAKRVTLSFLKLSFVFAVTAIVLLFCVPSSWLGFIFGGEFVDSKEIIYALGGGIIVLSCNMILSHYFSGLGKYTVNTIASVVGLVVTGGLSLLLIFLVDGDTVSGLELIFLVGLVTSLSYLSSFVYTFICFARDAKLKLKELQISRQDMLVVKTALKKGFGRMRNRKYAFHATPKKR